MARSKSQPAPEQEADPHASVTLAPPAPKLDELLREARATPTLTHPSEQYFRTALDASTRADSSLNELSKLVAELFGGLSSAKLSNERLMQELGTLRERLGSASEGQRALEQHVAELEQALSAADQEQRAVMAQQDEFLAALLDEYEDLLQKQREAGEPIPGGPEVVELAKKLERAESARREAESDCRRAREALTRAQAQRDEAQARALKRERERDGLRAEASQLRAHLGAPSSLTPPPPPVASSRPPSFRTTAALKLDAGELDSTLHERSMTPRVPSVVPRFTPPPELSRAVYTPSPSEAAKSAPAPSESLTAVAFPREATRPGVGGPKPAPRASFGPPPSGWTPPPRAAELSTAPPPRLASPARLPAGLSLEAPSLKQKPAPATRPLIDYSLGEGGVRSETLEGAQLASKPPRK